MGVYSPQSGSTGLDRSSCLQLTGMAVSCTARWTINGGGSESAPVTYAWVVCVNVATQLIRESELGALPSTITVSSPFAIVIMETPFNQTLLLSAGEIVVS